MPIARTALTQRDLEPWIEARRLSRRRLASEYDASPREHDQCSSQGLDHVVSLSGGGVYLKHGAQRQLTTRETGTNTRAYVPSVARLQYRTVTSRRAWIYAALTIAANGGLFASVAGQPPAGTGTKLVT